jgi:hypothetical protein
MRGLGDRFQHHSLGTNGTKDSLGQFDKHCAGGACTTGARASNDDTGQDKNTSVVGGALNDGAKNDARRRHDERDLAAEAIRQLSRKL